VTDPRVERWVDLSFCLASAVYGLAVWWPTRDLPYYWDSASFVVDASRDLLATHFHPLVASHSDFAHPPLFVAALALAWMLFGDGRLVSHALVLPALPIAMMATYGLGKGLANRVVGASAALLFGGMAFVVVEVGQVYMDLPIGAAITCALLAWSTGRRAVASLLFCAAAAMKLPYPLVAPAALALLLAADRGRRSDWRAWAALAAPFALVAVWLAYHRAVTGWTLMRPGRAVYAPHGPSAFVASLGAAVELLLVDQWRWLVLVAGIGGFVVARYALRRRTALGPVAPLVATVALGVVFFAAVGELALRYAIFLFPPYLLVSVTFASAALRRAAWLLPGVAAVFAVFATTWHPRMPRTTTYVFRPDENLGYLDTIAIGRTSARWLEQDHADAEIFGAGPEQYELTEPHQGYVTAPLRFAECAQFQRHPDVEQLVIVHAYHQGQILCGRLVEATGARAVKHFESNGKWLEVYLVPAPP